MKDFFFVFTPICILYLKKRRLRTCLRASILVPGPGLSLSLSSSQCVDFLFSFRGILASRVRGTWKRHVQTGERGSSLCFRRGCRALQINKFQKKKKIGEKKPTTNKPRSHQRQMGRSCQKATSSCSICRPRRLPKMP